MGIFQGVKEMKSLIMLVFGGPLMLNLQKLILLLLPATALAVTKPTKNEPILPIVVPKGINQHQAELGKLLFFDPRLSKSGFISCNSCHNLSAGGSDNLPSSIGHKWNLGPVNSPTVLNSSYNIAQFWDGRAKDLKEQAGGPIANPGEMASTHKLAIKVLDSIPGYQPYFKKAFGNTKVNIDRVTTAIAEFEKTLVTPNSRFDKWLKGDTRAINKQEYEGYQLFKSTGCVACHSGEAVGGSMFQKLGAVKPYPYDKKHQGRFEFTKKEEDRRFFKVPTLRNIELTYPYFHDGVVWNLERAVDIMADIQLGQKLKKSENAKIVAFLKTLTGDQPSFKLPILPPSTAKTPLPVR